jgi:HD-GYP domain-containing protein (c-di-GMP phosphodiesterase class II)
MKLCQPLAEHLQLHRALPYNVFDGNGQLLLSKGYMLDDESKIHALLKRGLYVDEDELKEYMRGQADEEPDVFDPFWQWEDVYNGLGALLREHSKSKDLSARAAALQARMDRLTEHDADVGIFIMSQLDIARYPVAHSLQAGFLCGLLARRLNYSDADRASLMMAAMTMNVAMLELQTQLFKQSERPDAAQREQIERHPRLGRERLEQLGVSDALWLQAVEEHHERRDGSGYPRKLRQIAEPSEILQYADVYCAMISPRATRPALPSNQAARNLYLSCLNRDSAIAALIVKEMGIYPPGHFVRLSNGDIAVVLQRGRQANTPLVASLVSATGMTCLEPIRRDTARAEHAVMAAIPADDVLVQVRPEKLFGYKV